MTTVPTALESIEVRNPATGDLLGEVPAATPEQIHATIAAARDLREVPAHERAALLARIADGIEARSEELARLVAAENGKPIQQTRGEVAAAIRIFRGFGEEAKRLFGRQIPLDAVPGLERNLAITVREPLGVVAAIVPFNYPVELYAHKAAAALAGGNAVIVKPPEKCPLALLEIAGIVEAAGAPAGAHQILAGGPDVAQALAAADGIQLISLTGSTAAGRAVAELAARSLKKVHLELGGNDAMVVCADADVAKAAEAIVLGRLARGNGQICCAVKRVYAEDAIYDELAAKLIERAGELVVGDPLEEATDVGPLINEAAAQAVEVALEAAVDQGATLIGGARDGAYMHPAILLDVPADAPAIAQEIFGPVAPLVRVSSAEEGVELANASPYGLHTAVFTRDVNRAFALARKAQAGGVIINGSTALRSENLPFGGVKLTGGTREGLHDTLLDMTEEKTIVVMDAWG
ncbi:MAG TPA: aldehyde dehydrogenase family protein [Baekduia sp.]|uniref:aldehyde dehydrogenase family protein n=1 Tax=Baekduia sp. TaxID=2600305 RepID=UPI002C021D09|nr:aldehyde dehydrogenase family protein [Baekduia sp.]HMJ34300.1 aldehyde dehydrogenase family protein [Baekduia sp.]